MDKIPIRNPEGYADPTAHDAVMTMQREQDVSDFKAQNMVKALKVIIDQGGYDLLARIEIRDRKSGRCYR